MKKLNRFLYVLSAAIATPFVVKAEIFVVSYGPSTTYVTEDLEFRGGNGEFLQTIISPSTGYTGPAFFGGFRSSNDGLLTHLGLFNEYGTAGGNDTIRAAQWQGVSVGDVLTSVVMFPTATTFTMDNTEASYFFLGARRQGGQTEMGVTGVRWVLRDTSGNFYISRLDDTPGAQFLDTFENNMGATGLNLLDMNWYDYSFSDGVIGAQIADVPGLFGRTEFDAAGFHYTAKRVSSGGGLDMLFAIFEVAAIPGDPIRDFGVFNEFRATLANGIMDTGDWMGYVYVEHYPWVFSYALGSYMYAASDAWFWVVK